MSAHSPWPNGCVSAVSLSFDDGNGSQLDKGVPILERHGLRATFYLSLAHQHWQRRLLEWQAVAAAGHEIGNHSRDHLCPRALSRTWGVRLGLEDVTLEAIAADLDAAQAALTAYFERPPRSFAYPCYADYVGEGRTRASYVPLVAARFAAGRGHGEGGHNPPQTCDLHYLWSWKAEGLSGSELIGRVELGLPRGGWDIFTFHGVDEGGLAVSSHALEQFCAYLARRQSEVWVAPVAEVAERIHAWRAQAAQTA